MTLSLIQTELLPLIFSNPILHQILTQALIQTKIDDHERVTPVLIGLHVIWDQPQGGGSPFSTPLTPLTPVKHSPGGGGGGQCAGVCLGSVAGRDRRGDAPSLCRVKPRFC